MSIKAGMSSKTQHSNAMVIQLDFIIQQENFESEIHESLAGIGKGNDIKDAIKNGVSTFESSVLSAIIESFYDRHDPELDFESNSGSNPQIWHPKVGPLHVQGYNGGNSSDENNIYNILKDEIKLRLGNKRFYWIKVYVSRQPDGKVIAQCTLNNERFSKAEQKMKEYAQKWEVNNQFKGEKQYIILRQCDKTWKPSKYDLNNMRKFVFGAIELFEECSSEEEYNMLFENIARLTGDVDLASELFYFIPELYCQITLPEVGYSDEIIVVKPDQSQTSIYLSQISSYALIKKLVIEKFQTGFNKEKYQKVLYYSASFKAINDAILKGSKLENLACLPLMVNVYEHYNPYR
jgi:hypothetical protein